MRTAALAIPALIAPSGCGDDSAAAAIEVGNPWARATPAGTTTGVVYMTLRAAEDDTLVGASVDDSVAASAIGHRTVSRDGQLSMDEATAIELPAGDHVVFEPGGAHVMLEDLASPLLPGESFAMTLAFERAPDLDITVDIRDDGP